MLSDLLHLLDVGLRMTRVMAQPPTARTAALSAIDKEIGIQGSHSVAVFESQRPRAYLLSATRAPRTDIPLLRARGATLVRRTETGLDWSHTCVQALASSRA